MKNRVGICAVSMFFLHMQFVYAKTNTQSTSCNQSECLRCNLDSNECVKCYHVMMVDSRSCLHKCPRGFDPIWAEDLQVFGWICQERSVLAMVSYRQVGIIAGISVLGAICIGVFLGVLLLHKKGIKVPPDSPPRGLPRILQDKRPKTAEVSIKGKERAEFLTRLRALRKDAPSILRMMTSTRNRFRSGQPFGCETLSDAKTKACKAVVRDLTRVLCLLSVKEEYLHTAPKDWRTLLSWTERLLARYKREEELKGENAKDGYKALNGEGASQESRTHFVTRKQQMKAEKYKRRSQNDPKTLDCISEDDLMKVTSGEGHSDIEKDKLCKNEKMTDIERGIHDDCSYNQLKGTKEAQDKNYKIQKISFSGREKRSKKGDEKEIKESNKNFINLQRFLKHRFSLFKNESNDNEEKDIDIIQPIGIADTREIDIFDVDEDIPSQTFFDHIEAFAFDLQAETHFPNHSKPDLIISTGGGMDDFENTDQNSKYNNNKFNKGGKNDFVLQKNLKNNSLSRSRNFDKKILFDSEKKKLSNGKEKRSSKLRRLSSSLLLKDRTHFSLKRERRPLKRQKRVDKGKHSKILEKYQKKSANQDGNIACGGIDDVNSCQPGMKSEEYAPRDRVSTIIPIGSFDYSAHDKSQIQQYENSKIKIVLGASLNNKSENLRLENCSQEEGCPVMPPQTIFIDTLSNG